MEYKSVRVYTGSGYEDFTVGKEVKASYITQDNLGIIKSIEEGDDRCIFITFTDGAMFKYSGLNFRGLRI